MTYVGRFAPSPTGPLHLGSIVTAVASFLHARQAGGEWFVRIEDIDPPREVAGAAAGILRTLESLRLEWDRSVLYQSSRFADYRAAAADLLAKGKAFRCDCSRTAIRAANESVTTRYPGTCRNRGLSGQDTAIRAFVAEGMDVRFVDGLQGEQSVPLDTTIGDYVVMRRDGLPSYHLAVVLDDAAQGVTTVVRGVDLLESTPVHIHLQRTLGLPSPAYLHLPVLINAAGQKLSKQTGAVPVTIGDASVAARALELLGLDVPADVRREQPGSLWQWALAHWRIESLRGQRAIPAPAA